MKLQITLKTESGDVFDDTNVMTTFWSADMYDCSIHAWFKVFKSVLGTAGFDETSITSGSCKLVFGDCRDLEAIKALVEYHYLNDWSDVND
jgi:hypothetical protein